MQKKKDSLKERLSRKILRVWPLPPPELRRNSIVPIWFLHKEFRLTRDGDYLVYRAFCVSLVTDAILFMLLYADAFFSKTGILVDPALVAARPLRLVVALQNLLLAPTFLVMFAFYLRLRLPLSLKTDMIPMTMLRATIEHSPRRTWIKWGIIGVCLCFLMPMVAHIPVERFIGHYHGEKSIPIIILMQLPFQVFGNAVWPVLFSSSALLLEKSVRFFPQAQDDLRKRAE